MIILAITGGIGCGKTTVLNWFKSKSIPTISADKISHDLVAKGQDGLQTIVDYFGDKILSDDGELDRAYLRNLVFSNPSAKQTLENIMHPLIQAETKRLLADKNRQGHALSVVEIPLLAETGKPDYIDIVWVIDCSQETQVKRVKERDNLAESEILAIINSQASAKDRAKIADTIIKSDGHKLKFYRQLEHKLAILLKEK